MFAVFAILSNKVIIIVGSILFAIVFAFFPIIIFRYIKSFEDVKLSGNIIKINHKNDMLEFVIPDDIGRVKIYADDLEIEFKKNEKRFVLRSHYLKNKTAFHEHFSRIIRDNPPSRDKVILNASVLEIMDRLKSK